MAILLVGVDEIDEACEEVVKADDEVEETEIVVAGATLDEVEVIREVVVVWPFPFLTVDVDSLVEDFVTDVVLYKVVRR